MNTLSKTVTKTILCAFVFSTLNIPTSYVAYGEELLQVENTASGVVETAITTAIVTTTTDEIVGPGQFVQQNQELSTEEAPLEEEVVPVEAVAPVGNRWGVTLNQDEINLMARIGELECGGESDIGQQAVFEVILNRVVDPSYPNTVHGVLSQRRQFTTWKMVNSGRANPSPRIMQNLQIVLGGGSNILPLNTVYFSRGAQNKRVQTRIGGHVFCNK